jgi:hypothetical protein
VGIRGDTRGYEGIRGDTRGYEGIRWGYEVIRGNTLEYFSTSKNALFSYVGEFTYYYKYILYKYM